MSFTATSGPKSDILTKKSSWPDDGIQKMIKENYKKNPGHEKSIWTMAQGNRNKDPFNMDNPIYNKL